MSTALQVTSNTEQTRPENRAFYPALDGLRAVAFLMVFVHHYDAVPWGWAGVDLFFVLSGFLITGILYDSRDDAHRARNFYIRRTLRIFPLYYAILLLLVVSWPLAHWQWNWKWMVWPLYLGNLVHLQPMPHGSALQRLSDFEMHGSVRGHPIILYLGHFWSLCVEEQFYLVWPWIVFWVRDRRKLLWICALTLPACLAARLLGQHMMPTWMLQQEALPHVTLFRLDSLLTGGLLALMLRGPAKDAVLKAARRTLPVALGLSFGAIVLVRFHRIPVAMYPYPGWLETGGYTLIELLGALVIATALQTDTWIYRVLNWRALRWAGRISYGAYVFHDIPHMFYFYPASHLHLSDRVVTGLSALLALAGTYLLAWLSFRYLESPFLNLKERWTLH